MHTPTSGTHGTRVVGYLRKSTASSTKQEASLEDQKKAVIAHADARGWIVEEWYRESASASKDRHLRRELDRLLTDMAKPGRTWAGVVTWKWDRLSRTDSLDQSTAVLLREAGVWLEGIVDGRADWTSTMGRMMWAMGAESAHKYSTDLSANTLRGRASAMALGFWVAGRVPYGYFRRYVREGHEDVILPRSASAGRPMGFRLKLMVNEAERPIVEAVYRMAIEGKSLHATARWLNEKGTALAYGSKGSSTGWTPATVSALLRNPAYKGDLSPHTNARSKRGKFGSVTGYVEGVLPALVDPRTWQTAVDGIGGRIRKATKTHKSGVLSGIVTCGHCGLSLKKQVRKSRRCASCGGTVPRLTKDKKCLSCGKAAGEKFENIVLYVCPASATYPGRPACRAHVVYEEPVLVAIRENVFSKIKHEVLSKALAKAPDPATNVDLAAMARRVEDLKRSVKRATARWSDAPDDVRADALDHLRGVKANLQAEEAALMLASTPVEAGRSAAKGWLEDLREEWVEFEKVHDWDGEISRVGTHPTELEIWENNGAIGEPPCEWNPADLPVVAPLHEPLTAHRDSLTALVRRLGLKVAVHWERKETGVGEVPTKVRIESRFDVPVGYINNDVLLSTGRQDGR